MPKQTYAVTVIKKIAYAEMVIIEAESEDDAHDAAINKVRMGLQAMEAYATKANYAFEVGSVVSINV